MYQLFFLISLLIVPLFKKNRIWFWWCKLVLHVINEIRNVKDKITTGNWNTLNLPYLWKYKVSVFLLQSSFKKIYGDSKFTFEIYPERGFSLKFLTNKNRLTKKRQIIYLKTTKIWWGGAVVTG